MNTTIKKMLMMLVVLIGADSALHAMQTKLKTEINVCPSDKAMKLIFWQEGKSGWKQWHGKFDRLRGNKFDVPAKGGKLAFSMQDGYRYLVVIGNNEYTLNPHAEHYKICLNAFGLIRIHALDNDGRVVAIIKSNADELEDGQTTPIEAPILGGAFELEDPTTPIEGPILEGAFKGEGSLGNDYLTEDERVILFSKNNNVRNNDEQFEFDDIWEK